MSLLKSNWDKIITILFASFALWFSCQANSQSGEALKWQKEQAEKAELVEFQIEAYIEFDKIYLHEFKEVQIFNHSSDTGNIVTAWKGLYLYVTLDIFNNSVRPISVDEIVVLQQLFNGWQWVLNSKALFSSDLSTNQSIPFSIEAYKTRKTYIRIPWVVEQTLATYLDQIPKEKIYKSKQFYDLYTKIRFPNSKKINWDLDDNGRLALVNLINYQVTNKSIIGSNSTYKFKTRIKLSNDSVLVKNIYFKLL